MKTVICCADVSDTLRVEEAFASLSESERAEAYVVCFDREAEYELEAKGAPFRSITEYYDVSAEPMIAAAEWTERLFYEKPVLSFYHNGVPLEEAFTYAFRYYIEHVLFFTAAFAALVDAIPDASKFILFSARAALSADMPFGEGRVHEGYFDAARAVAAAREREIVVLHSNRQRRQKWFTLKRAAYHLFLAAWNMGMVFMRSSRRPRLLASDYWRNIEPILGNLGTGELVFLDREQFFKMPWRTLFKFRARFVHIDQFETDALRRKAKEIAAQFSMRFKASKKAFVDYSFCNTPLNTALREAFQGIIAGAEDVIRTFEASVHMFRHYGTECVLLRASASRQMHFPILALAARASGIPAIENQHGLEYLGPGSLSLRRSAEYIGIYGPLMRQEMLAAKYAPERLIETGSPRFDSYRSVLEDGTECRIVCIVPDVAAPMSSYVVEEYLKAVAHACRRVPRAHVVIKMRPGEGRATFVREALSRAFGNIPHTIEQYEPLENVLAGTSIMISPFSTCIVEAMLCGVPVVAFAAGPIDALMHSFHFRAHERAGAIMLALDEEALDKALAVLAASPEARKKMVSNARLFLLQEVLSDGKAGVRIAEFIRTKTAKS